MLEGHTLKVGADPELFLRVGRHWLSGHHLELGTKAEPQPVMFGAIQNDGLAVEVNIHPAQDVDSFVGNLRGVLKELEWIVNLSLPQATIEAKPSVFFGHRYLKKLPPEVSALGCTPDFNAYTCRINPRPNAAVPFRTGAGHVHLGWTEGQSRSRGHIKDCAIIARQLDYYLGLPSLLWDRDSRRRTLYGSAGCFRPKPYGLEYRTLSNAWLASEELMRFVFTQTKRCFDDIQSGVLMTDKYGDTARSFIDGNDYEWKRKAPQIAQELRV